MVFMCHFPGLRFVLSGSFRKYWLLVSYVDISGDAVRKLTDATVFAEPPGSPTGIGPEQRPLVPLAHVLSEG